MKANIPTPQRGLSIEATPSQIEKDQMNVQVKVTANCESVPEEMYYLETGVVATIARILPNIAPNERLGLIDTFCNRMQIMLHTELENYSKEEMSQATTIMVESEGENNE